MPPKAFTEDNDEQKPQLLQIVEEKSNKTSKKKMKLDGSLCSKDLDKNLSDEEIYSDDLEGELCLSDDGDGDKKREQIRI